MAYHMDEFVGRWNVRLGVVGVSYQFLPECIGAVNCACFSVIFPEGTLLKIFERFSKQLRKQVVLIMTTHPEVESVWGRNLKKTYTFEILWVNYVVMNPFLKTLMYGMGSARRLRILWLRFFQQNNISIRFIQRRSICQLHIPVRSGPASTAPFPPNRNSRQNKNSTP